MVIVASEFTQSPWGMAAVDDIRYSAEFCDDGAGGGGGRSQQLDFEEDESFEESSEELDYIAGQAGPDDEFEDYAEVCQAVDCALNIEKRKERCGYGCPDGSVCFLQRRKRTGNLPAGVAFTDRLTALLSRHP